MPTTNVLLVLIIREAGLRSILTARLSLVGADLITANDVHDPALSRSMRQPGVLILDETAVAGRSGEWLDTVLADPQWRRIVLLCETPPPPDVSEADARLLRLERASATSAIAELIPRWQAED